MPSSIDSEKELAKVSRSASPNMMLRDFVPASMRATTFLLALLITCLTVCAQTTELDWQREAIRRYPDLGTKGSELNTAFVAEYQRRRQLASEASFFANPQWPLILAQELTTKPAPPPAQHFDFPSLSDLVGYVITGVIILVVLLLLYVVYAVLTTKGAPKLIWWLFFR